MIDVDTLLGDHRTRYFGDGHKRTNYSISEFIENSTYGKITQSGLWSNKSDKVMQPHLSTLDAAGRCSILELLLVFSQMAEMLAYHADDIDRECSETLWMKNVKAELSQPIPNDEISLIGKITKNKLLDMKGKDWKIFEMSGTDTKNRVRISSKIAHQLPSREV